MLHFNLKASNTEYRTKTFTSEHLVNYSGALAYPRNNRVKAEQLVCLTQGVIVKGCYARLGEVQDQILGEKQETLLGCGRLSMV